MDSPGHSEISHHFSGVFLVTDSGKIIGQLRDNNPAIDNPNRIGSFGGTVERGEDPHQAAWRELVEEETNLALKPEDIRPYFEDVAWRKLTGEWEARHFYYARITESQLETMEVYEGQGWAHIQSANDERLIELWRTPVLELITLLGDETTRDNTP